MLTYEFINKNNVEVKITEMQSELLNFVCYIIQMMDVNTKTWSEPYIHAYDSLREARHAADSL